MSTREIPRQQQQPRSPCWCDVGGSLLHSNVDLVLTHVNDFRCGYANPKYDVARRLPIAMGIGVGRGTATPRLARRRLPCEPLLCCGTTVPRRESGWKPLLRFVGDVSQRVILTALISNRYGRG